MNSKLLDKRSGAEFPEARPRMPIGGESPASAPPLVELVDTAGTIENDGSVLGVAELLLKHSESVDALARDETRQTELIPRFLAIALSSFSIFALAMALLVGAADFQALPEFLRKFWLPSPVRAGVALWLAYTIGLVASIGVCLPSFYFYGLLAGIKISFLQVTTHIMKSSAATAIMLMGLLPIYVSGALGLIVFAAPAAALQAALYLGLALPFLAGLWGVRSLYRSFMQLADTLPPERRCQRQCFLRRMTLACAACYTAVTPVMIFTLWDNLPPFMASVAEALLGKLA